MTTCARLRSHPLEQKDSSRPQAKYSRCLLIKAVFLVLAIAGSATLWMAVFADMGASLLVVFNGLRLLKAGDARNRG